MSKYTKSFFIKRFTATHANQWYEGDFTNDNETRCCALGHCGERRGEDMPNMSRALVVLLPNIVKINDGYDPAYQQNTPRARVLAALRDLP